MCDKEGENDIKELSDFPTNEERFKFYFETVKQNKGASKLVFVYTYLKSPAYLTSIKTNGEVWKYLEDNGIYLNNRGFVKVDQQEVIGFMIFKQPKITNFPKFSKD